MKRLSIFKKIPNWGYAVFLSLFFFVVYVLTMPPTYVGYADSDELITVAYNLGVGHPPGYPLYVLILHGFLQLPLNMNPAQQAHLFSALISSLTLFFVFNAVTKLYPMLKRKKNDYVLVSEQFESLFVATISCAMLAITYLFWTYSHVAEKTALTGFFTALIVFLYCWHWETKQQLQSKIWVILWVVTGLAIGHHQTLVLLIVPNLLMLLGTKRPQLPKKVMSAVAGILFGFVVSLIVLWGLNQNNSPVSWKFEQSLQGLIDHVTRRDFAGEIYSQGREVSAYFARIDLNASVKALIDYMIVLVEHTGIWVLLLGIVALRFGYGLAKVQFVVLATAFILVGPGLAAYLQYPEDWGSQAIAQRQFIASIVLLPIVLVFGWRELIRRMGKALTQLTSSKKANVILILVPSLFFVYRLVWLWPQADLSDYDLVQRKFSAMMQEFEPNAVVTCYSDVSCFALLYERYVVRNREDVIIVPLTYPMVTKELDDQKLQRFSYEKNPFKLFDIITWNLDKRPVYAVELNEFYYDLLGISIPYTFYIPRGYYGELSRSMPDTYPTYDNSLTQAWLKYSVPMIDKMRLHHLSSIGRDHLLNGSIQLATGDRDGSQEEFNAATNIFYQFGESEKDQVTDLRAKLERVQPQEEFALGNEIAPAQQFLDFIPELLERNLLGRAYGAARAAVAVEPENVTARLYLAEILEKSGDIGFAQMEYLHVLMVNPDNATAQAGFARLSP